MHGRRSDPLLLMRRTKKITLSAMLTALSAVLLWVGSLLQYLDLTVAVFASFSVIFAHIEMRPPFSFGVYFGTALLSLLLFPSAAALYYAVFCGLYSILKAYFERLPRTLGWVVKIGAFNLLFGAMLLLARFVFLLPEWEGGTLFVVALFVLGNVAFVCYDVALTLSIRIYSLKIRPRIKKYLK